MENLPKTWKVGELAKATGLTVRTLHHYEELGLLEPAAREENGYRLFTEADVARLSQIVAMKQMGMTLEEIGESLRTKQFSPKETIAKRLGQLEQELTAQHELHKRLEGMSRFLEVRNISADDFLEVIALMQRLEDMYTDDEKLIIKKQGEKLGQEKIREVELEWPELMAQVEVLMKNGIDPKDPAMQKLAKRWKELVEMFTGGNPQIAAKLKTMYEQEPAAKQFGPNPELMAYVQKAME